MQVMGQNFMDYLELLVVDIFYMFRKWDLCSICSNIHEVSMTLKTFEIYVWFSCIMYRSGFCQFLTGKWLSYEQQFFVAPLKEEHGLLFIKLCVEQYE